MKLIKLCLSAIILGAIMSSCYKEENDMSENIFFHYLARKVQFVWADNIRGEKISVENKSGVVMSPLAHNSAVKLSEYILGFSTCNVGINDIQSQCPGYEQMFLSDNYDPQYISPYMVLSLSSNAMADAADPVIENKIKQFHAAKYSIGSTKRASALSRAICEAIDYRITALKNIKVSCSKEIFGVKAGESLNDFFVIEGYPPFLDFIISSNKNLISGKTKDISLAQYLSYRPMAPAAMYMKLKKGVAIPANLTVEFTVELELENDAVISATTKTVTLIP